LGKVKFVCLLQHCPTCADVPSIHQNKPPENKEQKDCHLKTTILPINGHDSPK
jgi:hypothetical protein